MVSPAPPAAVDLSFEMATMAALEAFFLGGPFSFSEAF